MATIREKLETIQKRLGLTQTQSAQKIGVSFAAYNSWWNAKSTPRPKMQAAIDELFLEVIGQKNIPTERLESKKRVLLQKSSGHKNIVAEILNNPDIRDEFILKLTYHSNSIEGSTLTELDTAAVLFNNVALPDKSLAEQLEAKNHQAALNYLFDYLTKSDEIGETLILKLHSILMNSVRPDAGVYRNHSVRILGVDLPTANYVSVPNLIPKIVTDQSIFGDDNIANCAAVHSEFEKVHPFSDGNGRVGRLLMNAMLLKSNFAPAIIRQEQKQLYYTYLYKAQTKGNQSQLEDFLCDAITDGFKILERMDF